MAFNIPSYPDGATFADTLAAVKDGSIFKSMDASINSIKGMASSFPSSITSALTSASDEVKAMVAAARANMPRDLSIAQSNMEAMARESIASRLPSDTTIPSLSSVASGADNLKVLQQGPSFLQNQVSSISANMCSNPLVNSSFGLSTSDPATVGAAASSFMASMPPQTIPDAANPSQMVVNPAFQAFSADVGNLAKIQALGIPQVNPADITQNLPSAAGNLTSAISSAASSMTSAFTDIVATASAARAAAIGNLKANAAAMIFAASHNDVIAQVKNQHIDDTKISALNMNKGTTLAAQYSPATPPINTRVNGYKATGNALTEPTATATATPAPEASVDDRIQRYEIDYYYENVIQPLMEQDKQAREAFMASPEYARVKPLKERATAIKNAKPDESTRTQEEKDAIAEYNTVTAEVKQTQPYITHITAVNTFNEENRRYKAAVNAYATNASRTTLDAQTRSHLPKG